MQVEGDSTALLVQLNDLERRYFRAVQNCPRDCEPQRRAEVAPVPEPDPPPPPPPPPPPEPTPPPPPPPPPEPPPQPRAEDLCQRLREADRAIGAANLVLEWSTQDDLDIHIIC